MHCFLDVTAGDNPNSDPVQGHADKEEEEYAAKPDAEPKEGESETDTCEEGRPQVLFSAQENLEASIAGVGLPVEVYFLVIQ